MEASSIVNKFLALAFSVMTIVSCRTEDTSVCTNLKFVISSNYHGHAVSKDSVYFNAFHQRFRIETALCYVSSIYLHKSNGDSVLLKDVALYDFLNRVEESFSVEPTTYSGLSFGIGIPANKNKNVDPSVYANSNPLSVQGSNGMFWYWNTGYIFMKFDGYCDTLGVANLPLLQTYAFHVGDDPLYKHVSIDFPTLNVGDGETAINISLDLDSILDKKADPIDLSVDNLTHTTGNFVLAQRVMNHFVSGFHYP